VEAGEHATNPEELLGAAEAGCFTMSPANLLGKAGFGRDLAQQHKKAVIFGTDGLFSPGTFTISGSYVSSFGPPILAATHVIDEAIASVCQAGQAPTRANVMAAIRQTNEPTSILGQPISFGPHEDLVNGKFFLFKIDSKATTT